MSSCDLLDARADAPVPFGQRLINSDAFKTLFREGMGLVEETAAYLDGDGRQESRLLERNPALAYATESMRLTTRLMQMASWLLIQRAANEGEMSYEQAQEERSKVKLLQSGRRTDADVYERLPERLRDLIARTDRLHARILHLEAQLNAEPEAAMVDSPVRDQLSLIRTAFGMTRG